MFTLTKAWLRATALIILFFAICLFVGSQLVFGVKKVNPTDGSEISNIDVSPRMLVNDWYFEGNDLSQVLDSTQWSATPPSELECEPLATELPCIFTTGTEVSTRTELMQHFQSAYSNNTTQIRDASTEKKQIP